MSKIRGFLDQNLIKLDYTAAAERLKHHCEFASILSLEQAHLQSSRCMDCGIPFCHNGALSGAGAPKSVGCPVNNLIPDWNNLVYQADYKQALEVLHSTNNFPEFTGRICPAPCEAACTLGINAEAVGIKSIENFIIEQGFINNWVIPKIAKYKTNKKIAVVGSGPAGLATAQQLARMGHSVTVFEKNDRIGGLLRYGIPDFKLEKYHIDKRITQMQAEGVIFQVSTFIGDEFPKKTANNTALKIISPKQLDADFEAIILAGGAELARDLPIAGRDLKGVYLAMDFLPQQNKINAGDKIKASINAKAKHVLVIGGGDTGSDCVGTSNRQGAVQVVQIELMPCPPEEARQAWPYWPLKLRSSSSHEEGCERDWSIITKRFEGNKKGVLEKVIAARVEWIDGKMCELAGSEFEIKADLVFLALGFVAPTPDILAAFALKQDERGNIEAQHYQSSNPKVFSAGDMRRGQSLVVWAIREGRECALRVDAYLR
ncbi:glutamate synthase small subunit [Gammaproteobacteria bacterium]|nr:glutamate synthase small subunit [Gammaproteobacteria bacterium]